MMLSCMLQTSIGIRESDILNDVGMAKLSRPCLSGRCQTSSFLPDSWCQGYNYFNFWNSVL